MVNEIQFRLRRAAIDTLQAANYEDRGDGIGMINNLTEVIKELKLVTDMVERAIEQGSKPDHT